MRNGPNFSTRLSSRRRSMLNSSSESLRRGFRVIMARSHLVRCRMIKNLLIGNISFGDGNQSNHLGLGLEDGLALRRTRWDKLSRQLLLSFSN